MSGQEQHQTMNVAEFMIRCLESEGVRYIFGIPGEENMDLINALENSAIRFITTRHEQGAAFMADVYGRLTGRAGVCLSTLGPGATNLVTGVADANCDGAPLIAITGQVDTDRMHITSHQFLDLQLLFEPITKRTKQVLVPDSVNEIVRIAFKYAESEKPGAAHIDLPANVARLPVSAGSKPLKRNLPKKELADLSSIEEAAGKIFQAKNPVIFVGSGAIRDHVSQTLTEFSTRLRIPVINTMMAKGAIPCNHPYALWTVGIPQKDYVNRLLEKSDLVITVGYDIIEYAPQRWNPEGKAEIIHISTRPAHINRYYQASVEVVGDMTYSLQSILLRTSRICEPQEAVALKKKMVEEYDRFAEDTSFPMKPEKILYDVRKVMGEQDIVVSDVGAHKMWIARYYHCYEPNTCIISNGFASMGIAIPGAIGAKLVHPDKKILAITGDGGFMMNCQELETAVREKIPFVTLIFNDENYGLIKWKQLERFGKSRCVEFTNPDFVQFAESFHAKGYRVERAEDLVPTLEEAFREEVPAVIDCRVDYNENLELSKRMKEAYDSL